MTTFRSTTSRLALGAVTSALLLSACNRGTPSAGPSSSNLAAATNGEPVSAPPIAALPLATATPIAASAAPETLPLARAIHIASGPRSGRYRYVDRAAEYNRGFADTPPDYTVDYQGTRPWVWRANNGSYRVVENLPRGAREYYYASGSDQPFYVSDPHGGYAFDNGDLVAVYGPDGAALEDGYAAQRALQAAAYYDRARALYRAANYDQRQAAYLSDWQARRARDAARHAAYEEARARDAEWQAWHDRHSDDENRLWHDERRRRVAYAVAIGAGLGIAAVVATHGHDGPSDGAYRSNDAGRSGAAPQRAFDPRQGYQGYPPNRVPAGQVAPTQQPTAPQQQQRYAVSDANHTTGTAAQAFKIAAPRVPSPAHRSAAAEQQRAAQPPAAEQQRAAQPPAAEQQRAAQPPAADAHVHAPATRAPQPVAAATTVAPVRRGAKPDHGAQQAIAAARGQAGVTARAQSEAASAMAHQQTKSAHDGQRLPASPDAVRVRDTADLARHEAGDAARARAEGAVRSVGAAASRQQPHGAVEARRSTGQADVGKTAATPDHVKASGAQRQQQVSAPDAVHAGGAGKHQTPQAVAPAHRAAAEKGKTEKDKPGEQPK